MNDVTENTVDELYPNDGTYFQPEVPEDRKREERAEKGKVTEGIEFLEEQITYLQGRIAFYDSVSSIPNHVKVRPDEFMHTVAAHEIVRRELELELEVLKQLRDKYAR